MSSWLSDRLGIHLNLRPLAAPAGAILGGMIGGPAGAALGAGLFKTADNKAHGDSWGHALGQGALNAGVAYAGSAGLDKLRSAFGGGGGSAAGSFTPGSAASDAVTDAGHWAPVGAGGGSGGSSFLGTVGKDIGKAGSWIGEHPMAASGLLQGAGQLSQSGSENALRHAQVNAMDLTNQQNQYELEAKKRRDAALAPLIAAFQGQASSMAAHPYHIASNPYTS